MSLFNKLIDRTRTQLAYMLNYYPESQMPENTVKQFIAYSRVQYLPKYQLLRLCNEELTHMSSIVDSKITYKIQWAFNNVPTETEWDRKGDGYLIRVEFRISPITGPIALLSFGTVKHINPAWSN